MSMEFKYFVYFMLLFMHEFSEIRSEFTLKRAPNVVLIVANQFGVKDFALYADKIKHIQSLGNEAVKFSHVYSNLYPASSRAALLTGRLPVKTGMLKGRFLPFTSFPSLASSGGLPDFEKTVAEVFQNNGYLNKFVGLWDLGLGKDGRYLPLEQGFQSWFGILTLPTEKCVSAVPRTVFHKHIYDEVALFLCLLLTLVFGMISLVYLRYLKLKYLLYCFTLATVVYTSSQGFSGMSYIKLRSCVLFQDNTILAQPYNAENLTVRFTEEAVHFINQTTVSQTPFFLMVNHIAFSEPFFHTGVFASQKNESILGSLLELDWSVGRICRALEHANVTDDTIVVFTSLSGVNHGSKDHDVSDSWENNIKVPLLIKWSKKWTSGRLMIVNITVSLMDVMPTLLELTSLRYSEDRIDGRSFLPAMVENANFSEPLHEFFFHYYDVTRPSAVTHGNHKALFSTKVGDVRMSHDPPLLYDLSTDPEERSPLSSEDHQHIITTISDAVDKHLENRTRKWVSQFEHPILPWLFPCTDFPYCYKLDEYRTTMELD